MLRSTGTELGRSAISRRRSETSERLRYNLIARLVADEGYMGQASPPLLAADPLRRASAASLPHCAAHNCALGISLVQTYRSLVQVDAEWLLQRWHPAGREIKPLPDCESLPVRGGGWPPKSVFVGRIPALKSGPDSGPQIGAGFRPPILNQ